MGGSGKVAIVPAGGPAGPGLLHLAAAVPIWIAVIVFTLTFGIDWLARFVLAQPLDFTVTERLQQIGATILLVGAVLAAASTLVRLMGNRPGDAASRTPLAVWPGLPLALLALAIASGALLANLPAAFLTTRINAALNDYALIAPVLATAAAALATRERRSGTTAMLAGPVVILSISAVALQQSMVASLFSTAVTALVLAVGTAAVAIVARSSLLGYLAGGLLVECLAGLILAAGIHTPTELFASFLLLALPFTLILVMASEGLAGLARTLVAGASEIAALVAIVVGMQIAVAAITYLGYVQGLAERAPDLIARTPLLIVASLTLLGALIGVLVTPLLAIVAIALLPVPTLMPLVLAGSVIALVLRSIRAGSGTILAAPPEAAIDRAPALVVVAVALAAMVAGVLVPLPSPF